MLIHTNRFLTRKLRPVRSRQLLLWRIERIIFPHCFCTWDLEICLFYWTCVVWIFVLHSHFSFHRMIERTICLQQCVFTCQTMLFFISDQLQNCTIKHNNWINTTKIHLLCCHKLCGMLYVEPKHSTKPSPQQNIVEYEKSCDLQKSNHNLLACKP